MASLSPRLGFTTHPKTAITIISGTAKATDCKFSQYIHRVHPNTSPWKILEKREHWRIQGLPKFFEYPILSQERVKLRTSNLAGIFTGSMRTKALYKFGRKWSVGESRDSPIFEVPPIISAMGKATNVKFGRYIQRIHANKTQLKIWEKMERGRIEGLRKFFEYPLLSQERIKLRTSSLASIFTGSIRTKAL